MNLTKTLSQAALPPRITRYEWRRALIFSLGVMALTTVPYVVGWLSSTPQQVFSGVIAMVEDQYSYLAKMVQGAHGAWLFRLPYTATPHPGVFLYTFYLLLGKLAAWLGLSPVGMFQLARLGLGVFTLLVIYRFLAEFVTPVAVRFIAFLLVVLAGGLSWLLLINGPETLMGGLPLEFILPEGFTFLMLSTLPHLLLARALLLLGAIGVWRAGQTGSLKLTLGAGLLWMLVSILQPIYVAVILVVAGLMFLSRSIILRRPAWLQARSGLIAGSLSLPMVMYVLSVFKSDPTYGLWSATAITSPGPEQYAFAYAIPLLLAVAGVVYVARRRSPELLFLVLWLIALPLLVYAPTNAQRRLIEGWQIPLSVLAAYGLTRYVLLPLRRRAGRSVQRAVVVVVIGLLIPSYLMVLGWQVIATAGHWSQWYHSAGLIAATDWLERNASYADGVLATKDTGMIIPARAAVRVLVGHSSETIHAERRQTEVARFFDKATPDAWRRDLLRQFDLNYVWYGPAEQALGNFDPGQAPNLREVFSASDVRLYQVVP